MDINVLKPTGYVMQQLVLIIKLNKNQPDAHQF
jgi:hypothetical protein